MITDAVIRKSIFLWPYRQTNGSHFSITQICSLAMQAAVNMSEVELQYGTSAPLLKLANQIIAEQSKEIDQFKMILAQDYAVTA